MAYEGYGEEDPYNPYQEPGPQKQTEWGPFTNEYDPGPNWNGGVAPGAPSPRYDYNGGSPPDQALTAGHGWTWEGPQAPNWNASSNQWDRGVWQETAGSGLGYQDAPSGQTSGGGGGAVAPISSGGGGSYGGGMPNSGINVPSSGLPADILALFNRQPEKTPVQSAYQEALLKYMARGQQTPSLDDSILGPQTEVYRASQQRGQEQQRRTNAERAAANGQSQSGYLDNLINQGVQQQGFNTASFNANLLGSEMSKRREELQAALTLANATGNAEAARELQTRLAQASAMMQQQSLNLQGQLGSGDLALRQLLGQQGNDQFYDQLGVNTALNLEGLNQAALQKILSGL